ncbi:hypothetical protein B0H66DRAFT_600304 [Apodospora peruviana]|uniref:Cyanovirin-N domain-containing protein n=1 Tax=Apodospora peruviana TaxID=516989 RepID=A0AAE0IJG7_9PEZI|nr:hypothetical protein B0H66DRAFT_600304 [Apodospora peruviana]
MKSFFIAALVGLAAAAPAAPAQDFLNSCDANSVKVTGRILQANCKNIAGALKCSKLDLNKCLKNTYGSLQADPTGAGPSLADQCINCSNSKTEGGFVVGPGGGPTLVHCQCNPGTGAAKENWPLAMIDINTIVDNNNGILECYKTKGTAC